jgi:hypothetical protein
VGEKHGKIVQIKGKNGNNKKNSKKIKTTNFKEKRLLLMSKSIKVIIILPTLNK